jgi:hypothetical protein
MPYQRAIVFLVVAVVYLAAKTGCVAMAIWMHAAVPDFISRALMAYNTRAKRCFALGVVNALVVVFLCAVLFGSEIEPLGLVGLALLLTLAAFSMIGYSLSYHELGRYLREERAWSPARTIVLGGIAAEAAFMAPVIGQVFSVGVLFRGLGAVVSALLSRR